MDLSEREKRLIELHKTFFATKFEERRKTLFSFLTFGTPNLQNEKWPPGIEKLVNLATGLFIRSPKAFRDRFLKECTPPVQKLMLETMKETPERLGLVYDPAADPKLVEELKAQDQEVLEYYHKLYEKRIKAEQEVLEKQKKHEQKVVLANRESTNQKHEIMWQKMLHEEVHDTLQNPLPLMIDDLILHGKYDEAAKKFIGADLKVQKHVIHDTCDKKHKDEVLKFIAALEKEISTLGIKEAMDLPEVQYRAVVCIKYIKELLAN